MRTSWKLGIVAVMATSVALVLILGATIGSAAAPSPALSNDLVFMGNGADAGAGTGNIKVIDIDAMAVVNTIGGGAKLANNHGVLVSPDGKSLWNANASLPTSTTGRIVKLDLGTMAQTSFDGGSADAAAFGTGFCGIEYSPTGKIWATSMSGSATNGGIYEFDPVTGSTGGFVDPSLGTDNGATCGVGWNTSGTAAYYSLMNAKKVSTSSWPGAPTVGGTLVTNTGILHILDVAKTANYAYVAAGNAAGNGYLAVMDLSSGTPVQVNAISNGTTGDLHGPTVAHDEGFLYVHSRTGSASVNPTKPGTLLIYDIGGGTAGGTKITPVQIGSISDQGTSGVSCGTDIATKSNYCGTAPALGNLTNTGASWASFADYEAGLLTVDYSISNMSAGVLGANSVTVDSTTNTNGVLLSSSGTVNIAAGSSAIVSVKYTVPGGTVSFKSLVHATAKDLCNNSYNYGGPGPGA